MSQSPDGDFFDPEDSMDRNCWEVPASHSPLTGIFLIRSQTTTLQPWSTTKSQSPDGDFFDPEQRMAPCQR